MRFPALIAAAGIACSVYAQPCQPPNEMRSAVRNLSLSEGYPGNVPLGWNLGGADTSEVRTVAGAACNSSTQCATVQSSGQISFLYQVVDAAPYRGKNLVFHADVKTDGGGKGVARLLVRVHQNDCSTSVRNDMGKTPVIARYWAPYEIRAPISREARDIEFGVQFIGEGAAWVDNMSMTFSHPEEASVRALIKAFADARNAHNGVAAAALYSEDGEWMSANGSTATRGRAALQSLWGGVTGQVERTIESVDFPGDSIAVVRVGTLYATPVGRHFETFVVVKNGGTWNIRVHQSLN